MYFFDKHGSQYFFCKRRVSLAKSRPGDIPYVVAEGHSQPDLLLSTQPPEYLILPFFRF